MSWFCLPLFKEGLKRVSKALLNFLVSREVVKCPCHDARDGISNFCEKHGQDLEGNLTWLLAVSPEIPNATSCGC